MPIFFPNESPELAAIEMRLSTATLPEVHRSMEELTNLSCRAESVAQTVFSSGLIEAAIQRADELSNREMALNHQICSWRESLNDLSLMKDRLPPEDVAAKLDDLREKIFSCAYPTSPMLKHQLDDLQKQCLHLEFLETFPAADELNPDSFQSNLFHRLNADPRQRVKLQSLQHICDAAEEAFHGDLSAYQRLPEDIKLAVEQRLFERFPESGIEKLEPELRAAAIMSVLSDKFYE